MKNASHICFLFDEREKRGSVEHYWHFIFGYYLPLMNYLLLEKPQNSLSKPLKLVIHNCGPLMNSILADTLSAMNISYTWEDNLKLHRIENLGLRERLYKKLRRALNKDYESIKRKTSVILPRWDIRLRKDTTFPTSFRRTIHLLRQTYPKILSDHVCCDTRSVKGTYLLIKRSSEPSYYKPQGKAETSGYGAGRRSLKGIEVCADKLTASGVDCMIYEPGAHNIFCQMKCFSQCSGIIGVRGSDFANIFWMREGALVVLIHSSFFKNTNKIPPQRTLASLLPVDYLEIKSNGEASPTLDAKNLFTIIERHRKKKHVDNN